LVSLTDHLNDELRQKKLISGTDRRWGWLIARLYARHPFHGTDDACLFGRRLFQLVAYGSKAQVKRVRDEVFSLATCPIEHIDNHLIKLVDWIGAQAAKSGR